MRLLISNWEVGTENPDDFFLLCTGQHAVGLWQDGR
jgi:hypothetical protein